MLASRMVCSAGRHVLAPSRTLPCALSHRRLSSLPPSLPPLPFRALEAVISRDEGKRGLGPLFEATQGTLERAARALVGIPKGQKTVTILTGFPCLMDLEPPCENDGLAGAIAIARALTVLGHEAVIVTDEVNGKVLRGIVPLVGADGQPSNIRVQTFPPLSLFDSEAEDNMRALVANSSAMVAIERTGRAADGKHYTMRAYDMTHLVAPLDRLFEQAAEKGIPTIAIGDGGNELGMGKVLPQVHRHIKLGEQIACTTSCDHLLVASVSNWGGYALVAAMALVASDKPTSVVHPNTFTSLLPVHEAETSLHRTLVELGVLDGTNREPWCVDGMPFDKSMEVMEELRAVYTRHEEQRCAEVTEGRS